MQNFPIHEEVVAFVKAKAAAPCEVCGGTDWSVDDHTVHIPVGPPDVTPTPTLPAAAVICTRCGYIRLHAYRVVKPGSTG